MQTTPKKPQRFRPSIGEPSRAFRSVRAHSPGASSVGSIEDAPGTSPRRRSVSVSRVPRGVPGIRNSRDPRPVGDRGFAALCARNVVDLLSSRGYGKLVSHEKLLKDPSTKEFFDIFRFLISLVDPQLEVEGRMEDEVPAIMRRLKYPVEVNRSKLQAISGPNTWPQLLAVLDWLVMLVHLSEDLVTPLAECQFSIVETGDRDDGDHHLLRTLHENYTQFLVGKDDHSDEERLRQIYEERIEALQGEMERLREHHSGMEQRLAGFQAERERLAELQKAPAQLECEAERLRAVILSSEDRVQLIEDETAQVDASGRATGRDIEELVSSVKQLTEQVQNQAYSKKDIERLKFERNHLHEVLKDLRSDNDKFEQDVWELNMQESRRVEAIGRIVRQINEATESLEQVLLAAGAPQELALRIDLTDSSDALSALDFQDLRQAAHVVAQSRLEVAQVEEGSLLEVQDEQRIVQDELVVKDRECRRLRERFEQLTRMRDEHREWSAAQLDEALRTAEATEDAVHAVSVGTSAPSIRDAAEIDKLRLTLSAIREQGAVERSQLEEQIQRDEERFEDHRQNVLRHLDLYAQDVESLTRDLDSTLLASGDGPELGTAMCGDSPSPTKTPAAAVAAVARPSKAATRGGGR